MNTLLLIFITLTVFTLILLGISAILDKYWYDSIIATFVSNCATIMLILSGLVLIAIFIAPIFLL